MKVELLPALADNYIAMIVWDGGCCAVDPGDAAVVLDWLKANNLRLEVILNTHHHADHTAGNARLVQECGCPVIGPKDERIPRLSQAIAGGETFKIGPLEFLAIATPAHTRSHLAYYCASQGWLFSGDCLFGGGCGRCFEGTGEEMWESLQKLLALPEETLVFCGHEYTADNMEFAEQVEPYNRHIHYRLNDARKARAKGEPTLPSTIGLEKQTNVWARDRALLTQG